MKSITLSLLYLFATLTLLGQASNTKIDNLKTEVAVEVEKNAVLGQQINDMLFSFSELGFQEIETQKYLTSLLEKNGLDRKSVV